METNTARHNVFLRYEAWQAMPKRGLPRQALMDFFSQPKGSPSELGDSTVQDESGHVRQCKRVGKLDVTYWLNESAGNVMIVQIERRIDREAT